MQVRAEVDRRAWAVLDAFLAQCLANLGGTLREVFMELFVKDEAGAVRSWKPGEDIKVTARSCLTTGLLHGNCIAGVVAMHLTVPDA